MDAILFAVGVADTGAGVGCGWTQSKPSRVGVSDGAGSSARRCAATSGALTTPEPLIDDLTASIIDVFCTPNGLRDAGTVLLKSHNPKSVSLNESFRQTKRSAE